jgi:hypothetical protein
MGLLAAHAGPRAVKFENGSVLRAGPIAQSDDEVVQTYLDV